MTDRPTFYLQSLDPQGDPPAGNPSSVSQKLEERVLRGLREVLGGLTAEQALEALSQPNDVSVLVRTLLDTNVQLQRHDKGVYEARLRGLAMKQSLADEEGGFVSTKELVDALKISRQAIEKRREAGGLFGIRVPPSRDWGHPVWQFDADWAVLPGFEPVLRELPRDDPWAVVVFFLRTDTGDGETPLAALRAGRREAALRAARVYAEQGAI